CDRSTYSAAIVADLAGVRQYVQQFDGGAAGVSATDAKLLWRKAALRVTMGNVHTAIAAPGTPAGDLVFCSCGWGAGEALLKVTRDAATGTFAAAEAFRGNKALFDSWFG